MSKLNEYRKTIAAVVTGGLGWGALVVASEPAAVTAAEWLAGGVALATALGVYLIPNKTA